MLILLPPSETKRVGGDGPPLDLTALSFPELTSARRRALSALKALSRNLAAAAGMLRLGPSSATEAARNRIVSTSPTMSAIDRYDGVLFDELDAASLPPSARAFAAGHLAIGSALFGLSGALDLIPAYRLSHDSRLPGTTLGAIWRTPLAAALAARTGLLVDLRSEGYAALGPIPDRPDAVYIRVVSDDGEGRKRALNHFNKKGKGAFARRLLLAEIDHPDVDALLAWAAAEGIRLEPGAPGELDLVV
ncbi:YaaA family protein [Pseudolysinimonas yzui]|uniref:Peroxide stress protein YaaA n=1 Tax=Pseudolysinimonas yzui TaxID=2708254 RepID=A0A8J3LZY6_9MICO|nr:peroxide stress protein YaaA [Pseudolysinimonas yzui]GHF07215.1 peroxide stress protein YaaA [Pseudolysinimonas yzui]